MRHPQASKPDMGFAGHRAAAQCLVPYRPFDAHVSIQLFPAHKSPMVRPVRLHIVRRRGSNLQVDSQAINGLKVISVAPPSRWRNMFKVNWYGPRQWPPCSAPDQVLTLEDTVRLFREWWLWNLEVDGTSGQRLAELKDKNIACYCEPNSPCHGDVLLALANR